MVRWSSSLTKQRWGRGRQRPHLLCPAQLQDLTGGKGTKRRQTHWHRKLASMTECLLQSWTDRWVITDKLGGRVCDIQPYQKDMCGWSPSLQGTSLQAITSHREKLGGHFLHTLSTPTRTYQRKALLTVTGTQDNQFLKPLCLFRAVTPRSTGGCS